MMKRNEVRSSRISWTFFTSIKISSVSWKIIRIHFGFTDFGFLQTDDVRFFLVNVLTKSFLCMKQIPCYVLVCAKVDDEEMIKMLIL